MNLPITKLYKCVSEDNQHRVFKIFFEPDPNQDDFCVGMSFHILSVNRKTGEITFGLDHSNPTELISELMKDL